MARRTPVLLLGGLFLILASPAAAGSPPAPAAVTVRVEGAAATLVPRTPLTTTATPVVKDGDATHSCTGTSAAGALEQATAGDWAATWAGSTLLYSVDAVKAEAHAFGSGSYWGLFVNGYAAASGICGIELQPGDELLVAAVPESGAAGVLHLGGVPAIVKPGVPFTVTATRSATDFLPPTYDPVNSLAPVAGATVSGGGASVTTGADGTAAVTLAARGPATLRVTDAVDVRSAAEPVCVSDGADGYCGSVVPPPPVAPPPADVAPALPTIAGLGEQQRFTAARAPRELRGTVAADASGIRQVLLRLTRRDGRRCARYDGAREAWVATKRCGAERGTFFAVGTSATWSYLLPSALTRGRYVLDVRTVDGAGNVTRGATRGPVSGARTRVVFFVR